MVPICLPLGWYDPVQSVISYSGLETRYAHILKGVSDEKLHDIGLTKNTNKTKSWLTMESIF